MYPAPSSITRIVNSSEPSSHNHHPQEVVAEEPMSNNNSSQKAQTTATKSALKTSSNKPKKSVCFYNSCKIRPHIHYTELSWDELDSAFYRPDDYKLFKLEVKRTAKMIEMKIHNIDENEQFEYCYCTRGTEHRTSEGSRIRSKLQRKARNAVFKEQLNQYFLSEEEGTESTWDDDCYDNHFGDDNDEGADNEGEEEKFDIFDEFSNNKKQSASSQKQLMLDRQMANIDKLAAVYSECVRSSVMSAYMTGLSDEMTAYEISLGGEYYAEDKKQKDDQNDDDDTCSVVSGYSTNSTLFQRHPELLKQKLDNIASALLRFQRSSYQQQTQKATTEEGNTTTSSTRKIYSSAA